MHKSLLDDRLDRTWTPAVLALGHPLKHQHQRQQQLLQQRGEDIRYCSYLFILCR